jgi:hypothetical protein
VFTDPAFNLSEEVFDETFTYAINWGDGLSETGDADICTAGMAGVCMRGSAGGRHVYTTGGVYTVRVTITDDDHGSASRSFQVTVLNPGNRRPEAVADVYFYNKTSGLIR